MHIEVWKYVIKSLYVCYNYEDEQKYFIFYSQQWWEPIKILITSDTDASMRLFNDILPYSQIDISPEILSNNVIKMIYWKFVWKWKNDRTFKKRGTQ